MEDLFYFHINSFSFSLQTFSIESGVAFYISIYLGYYTLPCHDFKANMQEVKTIFKMVKSITGSNMFTFK